jgi:flagellar basal body-associated protein FliL
VAEGEGEAVAEEPAKKKGKLKLILMVVGLLVIGYVAASMTILKPKPLTADQQKAKDQKATYQLETLCAAANGLPQPKAPAIKGEPKPDPKVSTTTMPAPSVEGPVLTVDSVTVNLADDAFLKVGLGFQLAMSQVLEKAKDENMGSAALSYVLTELRKKKSTELGPKDLEPLRQQLGFAICASEGKGENPGMKYEGKILTVYFTDFVWQPAQQ